MNRQQLETELYPYYNEATDLIDITALCAALGEDEVLATFSPTANPRNDELIRAALKHNRLAQQVPVAPVSTGWLRSVLMVLVMLAAFALTLSPLAVIAAL
jgi:hypothetical protein